jgi:hypothetical protein
MATTRPYRFETREVDAVLSVAVDLAKSLPDSRVTFRVELERDLAGEPQVGVDFCSTTRRSSEPEAVDPPLFAAMELAKSLPDNWRRVTFSVELECAPEGPPKVGISFCENRGGAPRPRRG